MYVCMSKYNSYVASAVATGTVNADDAASHNAVHSVAILVAHDGHGHLAEDVRDAASACSEVTVVWYTTKIIQKT